MVPFRHTKQTSKNVADTTFKQNDFFYMFKNLIDQLGKVG